MGKMVYNWCIEFGLSDEKSKELALHSLDLDILEDFKKWSLGDKETFVNGIVSFINKREYNRINGNTK
jgi:hypothetical protein